MALSSSHSAILLQRHSEHFIDIFHRNEFQFLFRFLGNIDEVFLVQLWDDHGGNAGPHRGQAFFLQTPDRQNETAERDFAGHCHIGSDRSLAKKRSQRGEHRDSSRWPILRHSAGRDVDVNIHVPKILRLRSKLPIAAPDET